MNKITLSIALVVFTSAISLAQDVFKTTSGSLVTIQKGAGLYINGGVVIDVNTSFKNEGVVTIARSNNVTANFLDNTVVAYSYGAGKFVFTGVGGTQSINSVNQFERIDVDNAGLMLLSNIKSDVWFLKTGNVSTGSFIAIATSTAATAIQADASNIKFANSWINGKLRRYITPSTVNNYSFPVGNANRVDVVEMDNLKANPLTGITYITASFGTKPGSDVGLKATESGITYISVNPGGVWYLTPDVLPTGGKFDLKLFFNGFTGLTDNKFGILNRAVASGNAADWIVPANSVLPVNGSLGRTVSSGYARRNSLSAFNQFGIGITSAALALMPLSVETNGLGQAAITKNDFYSASRITVYPNPVTNNNLFINYTGGIVKSIKLIASDGMQISCSYSTIDKNLLRVTLPDMIANGIYIVQLISEEGTLNSKILVR